MSRLIFWIITFYQRLISQFIQSSCRFYPSCSQYALQAVAQYGVAKGLWLAGRRLLRCHPWADGGYDPILPNKEKP